MMDMRFLKEEYCNYANRRCQGTRIDGTIDVMLILGV